MTSYIWMIQNWSKGDSDKTRWSHTAFPLASTVLPCWKGGGLSECMHTCLNAHEILSERHVPFHGKTHVTIWKEATQHALCHPPTNTPRKSQTRSEEHCWDTVRHGPVMVIPPYHASWVLVPSTTLWEPRVLLSAFRAGQIRHKALNPPLLSTSLVP